MHTKWAFLSAALWPCRQTESTVMHQGTAEQLETWKDSQYSHSFLCQESQFNETMMSNRTEYSCDAIPHMKISIFRLVTHDHNVHLALLIACFILSGPQGNCGI